MTILLCERRVEPTLEEMLRALMPAIPVPRIAEAVVLHFSTQDDVVTARRQVEPGLRAMRTAEPNETIMELAKPDSISRNRGLFPIGLIRSLLLVFAVMMFHVTSLSTSLAADAPLVGKIRLWAFSPDKSQLFVDYCDEKQCSAATVAIQSGKITRFLPKNLSHVLASPNISHDGRQLAVVIKDPTAVTATSQIGILDLHKQTYRIVTRSTSFKELPSFDAMRTKIIFGQSDRERREGRTRFSKWDIYEVDIGTGIERRLTNFCFFLINRPQYLPDGKAFLFSGVPTCNYPNPGSTGSYRAYADRYKENKILRMVGGETNLAPLFIRGPHSNTPMLSEDGKTILFVSRTNDLDRVGGNYNYDLFARQGDVIRRLTNLRTMIRDVAASGDARLVTYSSDEGRNGNEQLWLMDLNTSTRHPLRLDEQTIASIELTESMIHRENK